MSLLKNKKAQGANYIAVVLVLVSFAFVSILVYTVWSYFVDAITTAGFNTGAVTGAIASWTMGFRAADYAIVLLLVFLILGVGLTSFRIATSATFFIITLVTGVFWLLVSYFFNYIFIQLVSPSVFSVTLGVFPISMIICTNLHWITLINIIVGSITLYAKREKGQFLT